MLIHTHSREYGMASDGSTHQLAQGPQIGDIFVKWEAPRSKLTGYPLAGRELTIQYAIEEIFDGGDWQRFTLGLIEEALPEFKPQWHVHRIHADPETQFIRVPGHAAEGVQDDGHLTLIKGEQVLLRLQSLLDKNSEGARILSYIPPRFERPVAMEAIRIPEGLTFRAGELTGTPTKVETCYMFLKAANRSGSDRGCLEIRVVDAATPQSPPESMPYWIVDPLEISFSLNEDEGKRVDLRSYVNQDATDNAYFSAPPGLLPPGLCIIDQRYLTLVDAKQARVQRHELPSIGVGHKNNPDFFEQVMLKLDITV